MTHPHVTDAPHPTGCVCPRCLPDPAPGGRARPRAPLAGDDRTGRRPRLVLGVERLGEERLAPFTPNASVTGRAAGSQPGRRRTGGAVRGRDFVVERRRPRRRGPPVALGVVALGKSPP